MKCIHCQVDRVEWDTTRGLPACLSCRKPQPLSHGSEDVARIIVGLFAHHGAPASPAEHERARVRVGFEVERAIAKALEETQ